MQSTFSFHFHDCFSNWRHLEILTKLNNSSFALMCLLLVENLFLNTIGDLLSEFTLDICVSVKHYLNINMYKTSTLMFMITCLFYVVGLLSETTAGGLCKWLIHFLFVPNWFLKNLHSLSVVQGQYNFITDPEGFKNNLSLLPRIQQTCVNVLIPNFLRTQV